MDAGFRFMTLDPISVPLSMSAAAHIVRRLGFGATSEEVDELVGLSASDVIDAIIDGALSLGLPAAPNWADNLPPQRGATAEERIAYNKSNNDWRREYSADWISRMASQSQRAASGTTIQDILAAAFRARMTLVWHNHFVTGIEVYRWTVLSYRYLTMLQVHALGSMDPFVRAVGLDPSMLIYLNGNQNRVGKANENYARELMELFTMGPLNNAGTPNYSEDDVKNISRALTGWIVDPTTGSSEFVQGRHDSTMKSIFGQTGNYGYDDVIDLLFAERKSEIAYFISRKLYVDFVHSDPDETTVIALADIMEQNNFSIAETLRILLKSQHFFAPDLIGSSYKSPLEHGLGLVLELGIPTSNDLFRLMSQIGELGDMVLFNPPNVAGWPGYHNWISTNSLPLRWAVGDELLFGGSGVTAPSITEIARNLHDPNDPLASFYLPAALAEHFSPVPVDSLDVPEIADDFGGDLGSFPVPDDILNGPANIRNLSKIFLAGVPWYEWYLFNPGSEDRLKGFIHLILQYPEYQLK